MTVHQPGLQLLALCTEAHLQGSSASTSTPIPCWTDPAKCPYSVPCNAGIQALLGLSLFSPIVSQLPLQGHHTWPSFSRAQFGAAVLPWWRLLLWVLLNVKLTCVAQATPSVGGTCAPRYISRRVPLSPYTTFGLHCRPGSACTTRMLCSQLPACAAQASRPSANALLALKSPVLSSISCAQIAAQHQPCMPSTKRCPHRRMLGWQ